MNSEPKNDIIQTLLDMRKGAIAASINEKFDSVVQAVLQTGRKGELTIKLSIEPSKKRVGGMVIEVVAKHNCVAKIPEIDIGDSVFFVADGRLTREDPTQDELFKEQMR